MSKKYILFEVKGGCLQNRPISASYLSLDLSFTGQVGCAEPSRKEPGIAGRSGGINPEEQTVKDVNGTRP